MVNDSIGQNPNWSSSPSAGSDAVQRLSEEVQLHNKQIAAESWLQRGVSWAGQFWTHSDDSLNHLNQLNTQLQTALNAGDTGTAGQLAQSAQNLITTDQKSLQSEGTIAEYGAGMLKTAGLFIPNKAGYALSALAYAADNVKPGESIGLATADAGLGLAKGLALKGTFDVIGKREMGVAAKGVTMGITSRLADVSLSRQTYLDAKTGNYSAGLGAERTLAGVFDPWSMASDALTFGIAYKALGKLDAAGLIKNKFTATVATSGIYGVSSGSVAEIRRQEAAGQGFDLGKILNSALWTGVTDAIAAAPGGAIGAARPRPAEVAGADLAADRPTGDGKTVPVTAPTISRNFAGATAREFQLVDPNLRVAETLGQSPRAHMFVPVREVTGAGELGPQKNMLVQHFDNQTPLIENLANRADVLASCNWMRLPEDMQSKAVLRSEQPGLWLTQAAGGRLRFTTDKPSTVAAGDSQPVELRTPTTVSDLLLDPHASERLRDMHDLAAMGKEMKHFKVPALRILDGGADSVVVELTDGRILKITDRPWDPTWGSRSIESGWWGHKDIDARILTKPQTIELPDAQARYYIQERARTPVHMDDLQAFDAMIDENGTYKLWDNDFSDHGIHQLGYVSRPGDPNSIVLLDYDAMRTPDKVPKDSRGGGVGSWWAGRYLADFDPRDR